MNKDSQFISSVLGAKGAEEFENQMRLFSNSNATLDARRKCYADTIRATLDINDAILGADAKKGRKAFADCIAGGASLSSANLAGVSIYAGIMKSYVQSIAPIFSVQRNVDTPRALIQYVDFYDIINGKNVAPNIGKGEAGWSDDIEWTDADGTEPGAGDNKVSGMYVTSDNKTIKVITGTSVLPRSVKLDCYGAEGKFVGSVYDDGHGDLVSKPGLITTGTIVYSSNGTSTASINVEVGGEVEKVKLSYVRDKSAEQKLNRAYGRTKYYDMNTKPLLVPVERNIIADHAMKKQGIVNNDELYANFIETEYTKAVNERCFKSLLGNYIGDTWEIDLSQFSISNGFYDTLIRSFRAMLTQAENELARKTYKGAKCTGYVAGPDAVDVFDLMGPDMGWVKNVNSMYYKDVVGWYNDVPVVRCDDSELIASDEIMLTHKTVDGYIAPLFHGMFLAPTELPVVSNYDNMTKFSTGMYSMEGFGYTTSQLCLKVKIKLAEGADKFGVKISKIGA